MPTGRASRKRQLTYRNATVADVDLLVDHRHRMWTEIGRDTEAEISEHDPRYRAWAASRLESGELAGSIVEAPDGSIVGSGLVWFRPDQPRPQIPQLISPYILSMYTVPEWRRRGIASRIVRELVAICREQGYPNVELHASKRGRGVYQHLGFARTWEMRYWIDRRIRRRRARADAKAREKGKNRLDRVR
jgi:GNAT superfamily N-acetyltransferase